MFRGQISPPPGMRGGQVRESNNVECVDYGRYDGGKMKHFYLSRAQHVDEGTARAADEDSFHLTMTDCPDGVFLWCGDVKNEV